jgi:predicted nucleic acid-binding protein
MKILVDTSALYAILDEDDPHHAEAAAAFSRLLDIAELVTHNYVHVEAELLVRRRLGPTAVATLVDRLLPSLTTVWIDEGTHRAAVEAWRAGSGKVSLVDHVSFVVMRSLGIERALAFDADFEINDFPRPSVPVDTNSRRLSEQPAEYGPSLTGESDLVGVAEIAARSGHPTSTVQSWRRRHAGFPIPFAHLATGPIWRWASVERWIRAEPRRLGLWRGRVHMSPDFDDPIPELVDAFEGKP